jgi:hypothetical protein
MIAQLPRYSIRLSRHGQYELPVKLAIEPRYIRQWDLIRHTNCGAQFYGPIAIEHSRNCIANSGNCPMQAILIGIAQLQLSNYGFSSRTSRASAESFSRLSLDAGASRLGLHLGAAAQHRADAHAPIV